ncbi:hypothetical protein ACLESD_31370 [Pyxidicoccus sp. 3LFB2]
MPAYLASLVFFAGFLLATDLFLASKRGLLTQKYAVAMVMFAVMFPALLAIPAGIITAIGSLSRKKDRGHLFMRSHFYLMAFIILMGRLPDLFQFYLGD